MTVPRKRPTITAEYSTDEERSSSDESAQEGRPRKRFNGHDDRCLTIHHAMRLHISRMMGISKDDELPDSYVEGRDVPTYDSIRFVWDKTPKQSKHNTAMRDRVLIDLKANRNLYKYVPEKDFSRKSLETVFEQTFRTFRQKFKAQKDSSAALQLKKREGQKASKVRRLSRKKHKLANRTEARKKLDMFSHPAFDGALQLECMSSEESGEDELEPSTDTDDRQTVQFLCIRPLPWRAERLQRFYAVLDEQQREDVSQKPKRGVGRKERRLGGHKEGLLIPPDGVASWMLSKRWIRTLQMTRPDLVDQVRLRIRDLPGFDWSECFALGAESDDEGRLTEVVPQGHIPYSNASYSLGHALDPIP